MLFYVLREIFVINRTMIYTIKRNFFDLRVCILTPPKPLIVQTSNLAKLFAYPRSESLGQ